MASASSAADRRGQGDGAGVAIDRLQGVERLRLQVFHRQAGAVEGLCDILGAVVPAAGRVTRIDGAELCWVGPGEWIVLCPPADAPGWLELPSRAASVCLAACSLMTDASATFEISGDRLRDLLARASTVDFSPGRFEPGDCMATRFAGIYAVLAWPATSDHVLLTVDRSQAEYLATWIKAVAADL